MPSVRRTKRRPSITRRAKVIAAICTGVAVALVFSGLILKQQERLAANAAEAATYMPATVAPPKTAAEPTPEVSATFEDAPKLEVQRPDGEPLPVLFVGDSLTGSLHASTEDKGFRPLTVEAMGVGGPVDERQGFTVGGTAGDVANILEAGEGRALAIVELGTNDASNTPVDEFRAAYSGLLDGIIIGSPEVKFLCAGIWQAPDVARDYDEVIREECTARSGVFVALSDLHILDVNRGPAGKTNVFGAPSDNFHPNDAGYQAISDRLMSRLDITG